MSASGSFKSVLRSPVLRGVRAAALRVLDRVPVRALAKLHDGTEMYVDLSSAVGRGIWWVGEFDSALAKVFAAKVEKGDVVVDVGANVGYFTYFASKLVGPDGLVFAVDMQHEPLRLLRETIRRARVENVAVLEVAVGAEPGVITASLPRDSAFASIASSESKSGDRKARVPMVRLDDVIPRDVWPRIRLLKMDVEGFEPAALRGAERMLRAAHPAVVLEIYGPHLERFGFSARELFELMASFGYRGFTLDGSREVTVETMEVADYNVLFEARS